MFGSVSLTEVLPLLLLLRFPFPTLPSSLHPFIPNALLISYYVLVIAMGIDTTKKQNTGKTTQKNIWHLLKSKLSLSSGVDI